LPTLPTKVTKAQRLDSGTTTTKLHVLRLAAQHAVNGYRTSGPSVLVWTTVFGRVYQPTRSTQPCMMHPSGVAYGPITIAIRARFEHDTSTTRYNTLRGFSCARIRDRIRESVVGVSCMLIDSSMHTDFTLYLNRPTLRIVCVNMPEIVYTKAIKCQYVEYTINHCEIIVMLK